MRKGCCFTSYKKGLKEKTCERITVFSLSMFQIIYIYILTIKFPKVF
jgi:hypothetical protein